jgi:excisionase family DNA binding protein
MTSALLIPFKDAAARCGVSVRTLEREVIEGKLAIHRIRSVRLVAPAELERYIAATQEPQCPSAKSAAVIKSASASEVVSVLNAHFRQAPPVTTRGRSKLRSAARRSTLRLVGNPSA